jgi:hypothetical protein
MIRQPPEQITNDKFPVLVAGWLGREPICYLSFVIRALTVLPTLAVRELVAAKHAQKMTITPEM